MHTCGLDYRNHLPLLQEYHINRKILIDDYRSLQIHGFCDASEKAYGACIYLRSSDKNGINHTYLVCSKSRVVPLMKLTLPRLELCAALSLSHLSKTVSHALRRLCVERVVLWSDSTITLHWIKSPLHTLKTFVRESPKFKQLRLHVNGVMSVQNTIPRISFHEVFHQRSLFKIFFG